jgi:hypothetical protein
MDEFRQQLKQIQSKHQSELDHIVSFMKSMKKKSRHGNVGSNQKKSSYITQFFNQEN